MSNSTEQKLASVLKMLAQQKVVEAVGVALKREGIEEPSDEQVVKAMTDVFETPEALEFVEILKSNSAALKWFKQQEPELYEDLRNGPSLNSTVAMYINDCRKTMAETACLKLIQRIAPSDVTLEDCRLALSS